MRNQIYTKFLHVFVTALILVGFAGCEQDDPKDLIPEETKIVNQFIYDVTTTYYLWDEYIPVGIDINTYADSYNLFETMKYQSLDHWSALTDNYQSFQNSLDGIRKTGGYKLSLFQIAGSDVVYGIVEFVYSGGAAELAGLNRGDIIVKIDGQTLTTDNYIDLFNSDNYLIGFGQLIDNQLSETGVTANIVKTELAINPILFYSVIDVNGSKIGYLVYDQFLDTYTTELKDVFRYFATENIDELVLDLRYNPGGYLTTCAELASMIVPSVSLDKTFITMQWNETLTEYLTQEYGENSDNFILKFPTPEVNVDMSRMVVLTSGRSASASEAVINGLDPYMDITIIGGQTVGKYTGASLFYDEEKKHDWGIYLVLNRISNALGNTDYVDGFMPDFEVADDYTTPLGDVTEPLLAKAIEQLTGVPAKKTKLLPENTLLFNKYFEFDFEKKGLMIINKEHRK